MNACQYTTHAVVLSHPDGGVHEKPGQKSEEGMPQGVLVLLVHVCGVEHFGPCLRRRHRVFFSVYHLEKASEQGDDECNV